MFKFLVEVVTTPWRVRRELDALEERFIDVAARAFDLGRRRG